MKKRAQQFSSLQYSPIKGKTLWDLYHEIRRDNSLSQMERSDLVRKVQNSVGSAPPNTPLLVLMTQGLGGMVGYLISKYFGMGPVGRTLSTLAGFGLGKTIYSHFSAPPSAGPPGWRKL